jgi:hypothetical protein
MKTELENLIGDHTYVVVDHESNRFNFCDLVYIDNQLVEAAKDGVEFDLKEQSLLPEDVQRAIDVMAENDVELEDYTGIIRYENDDITYYLLLWEEQE